VIERASLLSLEAYARERASFRAKVIEHKKRRTVALGEHVTLQFEDELLVRYQIQEMLRIERIFEEDGIRHELETYGPLVPDGSNWKATMFVEFPDEAERRRMLERLKGIERRVWMQIAGGGRIAAIAPALPSRSARDVVDVRGQLVLPGLIDTHAHVYQYVTGRFGLEADMVGVHSGTTTLVDQGGPSCMTLPGFRKFVAEPATTRVYAFLSAYLVGGLEGHYYPALYGPDGVDVPATVRAAQENADLVRGIKAHAEIGGVARWGLEVLRLGAEIAREADLPLYVHFGQLWPLPKSRGSDPDPDSILPQVVELLRPGDVLAHPFTRHPGGFVDRHGRVHPVVREALARGLRIDVGHGSHFSFDVARRVLDAGIVPDTLGADLHG